MFYFTMRDTTETYLVFMAREKLDNPTLEALGAYPNQDALFVITEENVSANLVYAQWQALDITETITAGWVYENLILPLTYDRIEEKKINESTWFVITPERSFFVSERLETLVAKDYMSYGIAEQLTFPVLRESESLSLKETMQTMIRILKKHYAEVMHDTYVYALKQKRFVDWEEIV